MVRRSTRNVTKRILYNVSSDSESEDGEEDFDEYLDQNKENVPEPNHQGPPSKAAKRRKVSEAGASGNRAINGSKSQQKNRKTTNQIKTKEKGKGKTKAQSPELEADWEENYLYRALASPDINLADLALDWIESYEEENALDPTNLASFTALINLVLRCCGSYHLFQPHDLLNLESASETIEEAILAFQRQKSHKFPFKLIAVFKKNTLEFFKQLLEIGHEKGILSSAQDSEVDDSHASRFMNYLVTWITKMTESSVRSMRLTSTEISLYILIELCKINSSTEKNHERSKKQLNRLTNTNTAKYRALEATANSHNAQLKAMIEYFDDISNVVIAKRYKDIDPQIRLIVLKHLHEAMISNPAYFCQSSFLRYFGWMLADPNNQIRAEVTRGLSKLYRLTSFETSEVRQGVRQFASKFQSQLIIMADVDSDKQVKANCLAILTEMHVHGFIEKDSIEKVLQLFPFGTNQESNSKIDKEYARFVQMAGELQLQGLLEQNQLLFDDYNFKAGEGGTNLAELLPIKSLAQTLTVVCDKPLEETFANPLMTAKYCKDLSLMIWYLLLDIDSIDVTKKGTEEVQSNEILPVDVDKFKSLISLTEKEQLCILKFIHGISKSFPTGKTSKDADDEINSVITNFIGDLPKLQAFCTKSNDRFKIFLNMWTDLIDGKRNNSVFNFYIQLDKINEYEEMTKVVMQYYREFDVVDEFNVFFKKLFSSSGLTTRVKGDIQDVLHDLVEGAVVFLRDNELTREFEKDDGDDDDGVAEDGVSEQKHIINKMRDISLIAKKIKQIGDHVNISNLDNIFDLLFNISGKLLSKLNLAVVLQDWKHNFILQLPTFTVAISNILDLVLIIASWKFEKLIDIPESEQGHVSIELEFDCFPEIVKSMIRLTTECLFQLEMLDLKSKLMTRYADLITSFKLFYLKFKDVNNFKEFKPFFSRNKELTQISASFQYDELLELFLAKEINLANILSVELDRQADEGVHYDDFIDNVEMKEDDFNVNMTTAFSDSEFESDCESVDENSQTQRRRERDQLILEAKRAQFKNDVLWKVEQDFSIYAIKLIALFNLQMVKEEIYDRIRLNSDKLGDIFKQIVEQQDAKLAKIREQSAQLAAEAEARTASIIANNASGNNSDPTTANENLSVELNFEPDTTMIEATGDVIVEEPAEPEKEANGKGQGSAEPQSESES
ncbi:uncharacterized protein LODBEIA_P13000 [Lodderomyces beijingensis]|uniref:SCD domain-containing protein n=1 Tax=Lodderomyces beijingensis TaxID=1775926 RepID=A0ABP0ZFX0_9ASCO